MAEFRSTFAPVAAGAVAFGAAAVAAPTVTWGLIFAIVLADTPALERSSTDAYGRPAMIFLAVAAPTPGSSSSSFSVAVFRSTFPAAVAAFCAFSAASSPATRASPTARPSTTAHTRRLIDISPPRYFFFVEVVFAVFTSTAVAVIR